jgi:hypothetical protein
LEEGVVWKPSTLVDEGMATAINEFAEGDGDDVVERYTLPPSTREEVGVSLGCREAEGSRTGPSWLRLLPVRCARGDWREVFRAAPLVTTTVFVAFTT